MRIRLPWLAFILTGFTVTNGHPLPVTRNASDSLIDSSRLERLLVKADRAGVASYLSECIIEKQGPATNNAAFWLDLAVFSVWSDNPGKGREAYSRFLSLVPKSADQALLRSNRLLYQALILADQKQFNQAADSLLASINIRPRSGKWNLLLLADSYGKLARFYKKTGDLAESSRNFERSINLNRKNGRLLVLAEDLSDLSSVLSLMNKDDPQADAFLRESLGLYQEANNPLAQAQVLHELGVLFRRRNDLKGALNYFKESLNIKSRIPELNRKELIVINNSIGICYQDLANADSARYYFLKAVDYAIRSKSDPAPFYANLGASYGGKEDYSRALEYFQYALHALDSTCLPTDLSTNPLVRNATPNLANFTAFKAHTYHRRYIQLHNPQDLVNGLNTFMVALEMIDTLRFWYSFDSKPFLTSEAKIHYFNALDMALDLYYLTGKKGYLNQAFQLSERNKSANLNEFLRTNKAREFMGNVAPWIKQEDSIKSLINNYESKIVSLSPGSGSAGDSSAYFISRREALTDELKSIDIEAKRDNPAFFNMVYSNKGYLPEEIQKHINPGEALIDYTVIEDKRLSLNYMVAFILTKDTIFTLRDTLPNKFREDIKAFRSSITALVDSRVFKDFSHLSNLMYRYFFQPIETFHGINRLILLPDEELGFLPFEVFVTDTVLPKGSDFRKLSYLNRKYAISYISSHEQFYQFRNSLRKTEKATVYAFAPFVSKGVKVDSLNLLPLKNSGKEVRVISKYFRTRIFENARAVENSLRKAFQKESVITLSTHGIMNSAHPMESRLILNPSQPDWSLYLFELMSLRIKSSLVILNACNTGNGKLQVGEGIMSMARGFQYAGVPSVITTLWPIDDQSSAIIMNYFFKNLHDGMDEVDALMKARNSYIDQSSKTTGAPYFWAGQVLIGDPGPISIQHRQKPIWFIGLLIAGILVAGLLVGYKKRR